jgi:hypothetical protein
MEKIISATLETGHPVIVEKYDPLPLIFFFPLLHFLPVVGMAIKLLKGIKSKTHVILSFVILG